VRYPSQLRGLLAEEDTTKQHWTRHQPKIWNIIMGGLTVLALRGVSEFASSDIYDILYLRPWRTGDSRNTCTFCDPVR
jgi:hypothetical protein